MLRKLRAIAGVTRLSIRLTVLLSAAAFLLPSTAIASGSGHSLIVKSDGTVWAAGGNANGQIGDNTTTTRPTFVQVPGLSNVVKVATGAQHSMAITSTGALYVWGDNAFGQIGDGSLTDRKTPVLLSLTGVTAIVAGEYHSVALKSNGAAYVWGKNLNGQIGNGKTTQRNTPFLAQRKVSAIGAGFSHTLFTTTTGTAFACGLNTNGQLGDGTTTQRTRPVQMTAVSGAAAVAGGDRHSVVLLSAGTLVATGYNGDGALGDGTTTSRTRAVPVVLITGVSTISSGATHVVARKSDGTLWTWGRNHLGQLADGTITNRPTPQQIAGLPTIATTGAGEHNTFAITSGGVVYAWGDNSSSQLGDGTTVNRWLPVQVSDAAFAWRVATPTLSVDSGTYAADQIVVIANETAGSTIRYTKNGIDPTESDPSIVSGGSIAISQSQTLKTKAWKTGMLPSAVTTAVYILKVATPTFSPAAGAYTAAQSVTISSTSAGTTLRYTLDGTDPSGGSSLYSAPIASATTSTLKAIGFRAGWSNSDVSTATYAMNFGTLAAPIVDPPSGIYTSSASVTMSSGQSGATIRYTTDNTPPTISSTLYSGAVSITTTTTVRAKALHPDYTTSAETSRTYTITAAPPTIDVASGAYESGSMVNVSTTEAGAILRMTIDGTDPGVASPVIASGTSLLLGNFTLKVRAFRSGVQDSAVASAVYTLTGPLGPGSLAGGSQHSLLATTDGRVYGWGSNALGQIGDASTNNRLTPTLLNTITGVTQLAGGLSHTLARTWSGQVYAWGSNGFGRLGDGTTTQRTQPTLIPTLANIVAVAAGDTHSLALASDGRVYAWGGNANGQLGLGSTTNSVVPTEISTLANVVAIAAGSSHSFAVTAAGQLYAWGLNTNSRLGDGTTTERTSPVLLGLSNVVSASAGASHSVALTADGRVYTWGLGSSGQLGLGSTATMTTPALVPGVQATAIAAGDHFTAAVRHDGVLVAWGANGSGQVGDLTMVARTSPTIVAGPASVSTVALGDSHALVVTPDGALWTWGNGTSGRLGDNATTTRATPQSVMTGLTNWRLAAPTISLPSATANATLDVRVVSSTAGVAIRYTLTGGTPTETDALVPTNGLVSMTSSSMLRARAFLVGRPASAEARADYLLQSATPTIDPPTGIYQSAQTVTLSSVDPTATIRFTLDGTDPTPASVIYSAPFAVSTSQTIKARADQTNGLAPSAVSAATLTFGLPAPVASPAGGVFQAAPTVSLSSIAGASIRYTLNGTTPTASSTLYTAPITIASAGATLKSVTFHPDWPASAVRTDVYIVDATAPTITAQLLPAALNAWNRTPVTVNFLCFDNQQVASCSTPATFSQEGAGQTITGTAVDAAGNQTQLPVTLNLDFAPPTVSITSPVNGLVTSNTALAITGQAADALSGLAAVSCNGVAATVTNGAVSCDVTLRPGRNVVVVAARDVAGNGTSSGVTVTLAGTMTQLTLNPSERTMLVGETGTLTLRDEFGIAPANATWQTGNASIVSLSADNPPVLTANAIGTVTITASKNGLGAGSTITVVAGETLPVGATRWSLPTVTSTQSRRTAPIYVDRSLTGGPDLFTVEPNAALTEYTMRAVSSEGEVLWKEAAPGLPLMGDSYGAVVAGVPGAYRCAAYYGEDRFCFTAVVRFGGTGTVGPWRYDSAGYLDRPAQGPDGTIFAIEHLGGARAEVLDQPDYGNNKSIVMLDGATGQVTGRVSFAPETRLTACGLTENEPLTIGPIVGADGNGYVAVRQRHRSYSGPCNDPPSQVLATDDEAWTLLRLSRTGELARAVVDECHMSCGSLISPQQLLPDGIGGLVVNGRRWLSQVQAYEQRVIQLDAEFARADFVVANATRIDLVGQAGTLFLQTKNGTNPNATTQAFDLPSGTTRWTATPGWPLVAAAPDGGAAAQTSTGELMQIDANGQFDGTISTTPLTDPVQIDNAWLGNGTANLKAVASNFVDGTSFNRTSVSVGVGLEEPRAYGSRLNQSGPPPGHATVQQAAVEMLRAYNGRSIYLDREFGGSICRNAQQRYIATFSQPDQPPNSDFVYSTGCERLLGIAGLELAGRYHTHGKFGSVGLSPYGDVINAQNNATTPWFVASPCGGIYEYSAYTTPRPWYRWLTSPSDLIPIYGKPLPQRATGRQPCPVDVGIPYPPQ